MNRNSLWDIPVDINAFPASTRLSEFTHQAMIRLYHESMPQGPRLQQEMDLEFYLTHCQIETHMQEDDTLYDLELKGTKQSPLNIFVIRTGLKYLTTSKDYDRFGFTYSLLRGVSRFVTCLQILLSLSNRTEDLHSSECIRSSLGGNSFSSGLDRLQTDERSGHKDRESSTPSCVCRMLL